MKMTELLENAKVKASCGCTEESCSHCSGKHTLDEVGETCKCCGNKIKEVKVNETATAGATSAGAIASISSVPGAKRKITKRGKYGAPEAPQKRNSDGTAKNALDLSNNLMGGNVARR